MAATSAAPRFAARALACRRGERLVFRELEFALGAAGALVLTGPNGSGKSSLLRVLAGLTPPVAGELTWEGRSIAEDPAQHRARLRFIGHLDAVKPALTLREWLAFWAGLAGAERAAVGAALARFRLEGRAELPCRVLSAGQRRRLSLARLLLRPAPLWLLDEPATGLDDDSMADLLALIAEHRAAGGMVVLSTHQPLALPGAAALALERFAPRRAP